MASTANLNALLSTFPSITLDEMKEIRLMRRTDTKFVAHTDVLPHLLEALKGEYYVQRVKGEALCYYSTTYFDDERCSSFRNHQAGNQPRVKVRVRTYAQDGGCFLEIKKKDNHGKTRKKRIAVSSLENVLATSEGEDFLRKNTGWDFQRIVPRLHNNFRRITLVNRAKTERLTIDFSLQFQLCGEESRTTLDDTLVIELKREGRAPSPLLPVLRKLRIKPNGFSKYCVATAMSRTDVRVNRFKKKLRNINKAIYPYHTQKNKPT